MVFPELDAMFLDPHDSEWDDDMTYLYVDYPFYKKYRRQKGMFPPKWWK